VRVPTSSSRGGEGGLERPGVPEAPWRVVDPSLQPNDRDLALVEQDVLDPWKANRTVMLTGRFAARRPSVRTFRIATPLDGALSVSVSALTRISRPPVSLSASST